MTHSIALVTAADIPAHKKPDEQYLVDALRAHDFICHETIWSDPAVDWTVFDIVLLRSTWDYHLVPGAFADWLDQCTQKSVRLFNPATVVHWNMHKSYLVELARQGVAVIPSRLLPRGKKIDLSELLSGHNEIVIKPAISATAWHTVRIHREYNQRDPAWLNEQLAERDMLVQPFVPDISNHGELSFMFFDGKYSHAVLKQARDGEFRVQSDFGGTETFYQPGSQEIDEAAAMLRTLENPPLYARVDAARLDGKLVLMELEMIEPQLFLRLHEPAVNQFISAILEKCIDKKTGR